MLKHFLHFKLRSQLIIIMITMLILFAWSLTYLQGVTEDKMLDLIEDQVNSMTEAIEISIEQIYAAGSTDETRFKNFVDHLQKQGVEEVSILSKQQEVLLSSNPQMVGTKLSVSKNEFLIQEKIGTDNRLKTKKIYNTFVPIISKGELEGYIQVSLYFEDLEKLSREMLFKRIVWALLVVGIGLILCIVISYWYTKPIPVLIKAIHSITQGQMPRLPAILQADISDLADSVNNMFKKLQDQKQMEEKLNLAKQQAMLGQLASGIAHDIRNPLNFISLSVDHLGTLKSCDDAEGDGDPKELIRKIQSEIQRVNQMVTNFLDLGREVVLHPMPLKADLAVEEALGLNSQLLRDHGISVERNYCDPMPVVEMDIDRIKSCFQNLVANAAEAMPNGGTLLIAIMLIDGSVNVAFEDSGEGITPENLPQIFKPYFTTKRKGIGLGLAIAKRVIESHKGSIDVTSTPGKGTLVSIMLPRTPGEPDGEDGKVENTHCRG